MTELPHFIELLTELPHFKVFLPEFLPELRLI